MSSSDKEYWENIYLNPGKGGEKGGTENVRFAEVFKLIDEEEDEFILDVGAGYAQLCRELKIKYPNKMIAAADFSDTAAKASHYKPYFIVDCYDMPFEDKSFDLLISTQMIEYLDEPKKFFQEAARIARRGIFTAPNDLNEIHNRKQSFKQNVLGYHMSDVGKIITKYEIGSLTVGKVSFND